MRSSRLGECDMTGTFRREVGKEGFGEVSRRKEWVEFGQMNSGVKETQLSFDIFRIVGLQFSVYDEITGGR